VHWIDKSNESYTKRTLKNEVSDAIGDIDFKSMLIFLRDKDPGLQGREQMKDFVEVMLVEVPERFGISESSRAAWQPRRILTTIRFPPKPASGMTLSTCQSFGVPRLVRLNSTATSLGGLELGI